MAVEAFHAAFVVTSRGSVLKGVIVTKNLDGKYSVVYSECLSARVQNPEDQEIREGVRKIKLIYADTLGDPSFLRWPVLAFHKYSADFTLNGLCQDGVESIQAMFAPPRKSMPKDHDPS
ncbi:MAG: hypothetical protein SP1CHLAM54_11500 [Chlamydiia bacterium]|nr:hypothetical protein [Chlamydiia bacterium]MCH9616053.1 hypothetical protein [Chlamydiia bacterium]MCH9629076.1 hypothetical protein [Chlamydiia bacterium]